MILDDFGLQTLTDTQQKDFFELISHCHERMTTIITFKEWPQVFNNSLIGSAAMDRLVHRALRLTITGPSYRLKTFMDGYPELPDESTMTNLLEE